MSQEKRKEALELMHKHIKSHNMRKHCLASEAVMRALAARLDQDVEAWGLAGLLHDIDVEITGADPATHGPEGARMLEDLGYDAAIVDAVKMHNEEATGQQRNSLFQHALAAGETITGLITATALVYPDKKVASVKPKSIRKRMKQKAFAASVKRENITEIEKTGLSLDEFIEISLKAMSGISDDLGL